MAADARWYETWGTSGWKEEAWRDPWVFRDPKGTGWHMLVTARANHGALDDRGVIGHAFSPDLLRWEVRPPLTAPGSGFAHLEVPQVTQVGGRWVLLFSATRDALSEAHADRIADPGTWAVMVDDPTRPFDVTAAQPLTTTDLYSGRLVDDRRGRPVFLAFRNADAGLPFVGGVTDPVPFTFDASGLPMLATTQAGRS